MLSLSKFKGKLRHKVSAVLLDGGDLSPTPTKEKHGLFEFRESSPDKNYTVDIVAVHGLGGDWEGTWTDDNGKLWLRDFLARDIPAARVMSYGYNSTTVFSKAITDINDEAAMLLARLDGKRREDEEKTRPIIFVAHSLGGIVVKKALVLAHERSSHYGDLLDSVHGCVFFGVPHRGADTAYWLNFAASILKVAQLGTGTNTNYLAPLQRNSAAFADISQQFIERGGPLQIRTFLEGEKTSGLKIVDKASAQLGLPNEIAVTIAGADHRTMCRFSDAESQKYSLVKDALGRLVSASVNPVPSLTPFERECLQCLCTSDYDGDKERIPSRIDGTCMWFLQHEKYLGWLEKEETSLLWVSGDPGCGKTVLSSFLVDELNSSAPKSENVCFFFCDDKLEQRKDAKSILASLLHQILSKNHSLIKHARRQFENLGSHMVDQWKTLWDIFEAVCADPQAGGIKCVIDALDECEEKSRGQLIKRLVSYFGRPKSKGPNRTFLKVLVTSRPYESIEEEFRDISNIRLKTENETENISTDIATVVKSKLDDLKSRTGCSERTRDEIERRLVKNADRTFLWVSLVLELLKAEAEASEEVFLQRVAGMPEQLDEVYDSILRKVPQKDKAQKALAMIVIAVRPLTLTELNIALNIRETDKSRSDVEPRLQFAMERSIKKLCGPFVRIIDSKAYLVHQTAKEFLIKPSSQVDTDGFTWKHCLDRANSHLLLARSCIWYLSFDLFENHVPVANAQGKTEVDPKKYDLLEYAAKFWAVHFRRSGQGESALSKPVSKLYDIQSNRFLTWFQVFWTSISQVPQCPRNMTPLMVASYFGHQTQIGLLLRECDVNTRDTFGWTALHWAAWEGLGEIWDGSEAIRPLLDAGVDVAVQDKEGLTALQWAAINGQEAVVRLLLDAGAEYAVPDNHGNTPLHSAVRMGRDGVVRLLLKVGADIEAKTTGLFTPLHIAAINGLEGIMQVLIENNAELEVMGGDGKNALHIASREGYEKVVKLLIEKGAKIEARATIKAVGSTPLHHAASGGHEGVLRLLLDNKAELEAENDSGLTCIHFAASGGHERTLNWLLERGANAQVKDKNGHTWLTHAAQSGHNKVVAAILERGADVESKDSLGWTALTHAAAYGHNDIVRQLLGKGANPNTEDNKKDAPLHFAAMGGHEEAVGLLLEKGANANVGDTAHWLPSHQAASGGHQGVLELLLDSGAELEARTSNRHTILHIAAQKGHEGVVGSILKRKPDIDATDDFGWSALSHAAVNAHGGVVKLLLGNGANTEVKGRLGWTALHHAAIRGHAEVLVELLGSKAGLEATADNGSTALQMAAEKGDVKSVEVLLDSGANLQARSEKGATALHYAALFNVHEAVLQLLIQRGADIEASGISGRTPLHEVAENGRENLMRLLMEHKANMEAKTPDNGLAALHIAAGNGREGAVTMLLDQGADIANKDAAGWTALHHASYGGYERVVQLLIERGANIEAPCSEGSTALQIAVGRGHEATLHLLLQNGANPHVKDDEGSTLLHWAAQYGQEQTMRAVLECEAIDTTEKDNKGQTAFMVAALNGHEAVVRLLLELGADIEESNGDERWTALHRAANGGHEKVAQLLVERRANVKAKSVTGVPAIHAAAHAGHEKIVHLLLENGADAQVKDDQGLTSLHYAALSGHEPVVRMLLNGGFVNIAETNTIGQTAFQMAAANGHEAVVQFLLESGANVEETNNHGCTTLQQAAFGGHEKMVQFLVENNAIIEARSTLGSSALSYAAMGGHEATVRFLLARGASYGAEGNGATPLQAAASGGHESIIRLLLEKGADPRVKAADGSTLLHFAACGGHDSVVRILLESETIDVTAEDEKGRTAFQMASEKGHQVVAGLLAPKITTEPVV
ncbi:MAG: hypothetical protein M1813_009665 [Trichoglossum hirsutum]|nr:MAG: hypothetical protein M1813_009665 [Trichoglossum hirsutum]